MDYPKPESDPLTKQWAERIKKAKKHWEPMHKRMRHNRKTVTKLDWKTSKTDSDSFYGERTNLIFSTIAAMVPNLYAKNPEISAQPLHNAAELKLFCETLQTVVNRQFERANLKKRAKSMLWACMSCYYGVLKVMYQRDMRTDPIIESRINDAQDNISHLEKLIHDVEDPLQASEHEAKKKELEQTLQALQAQPEVVAAEGLVIDKVLSDNLLIDPDVGEFDDYEQADWMAQVIPMKKSTAEAMFKIDLTQATPYGDDVQHSDGRFASGSLEKSSNCNIKVIEIWDKSTMTVYTMVEGVSYWVKAPGTPAKVGERWYPFFLFPFSTVDGEFVGPCLVDLTERLQNEYNETRDKFAAHRDMNKPGLVASGEDVTERDVKKISNSELGEVVIVTGASGKPINQMIMPKPTVPINPIDYDTGAIRSDWEQVTGLQDAARSTVVTPKTATEASIMQQSLSGRVSEMRDRLEDFLQQLSQYAAQMLMQELTSAQVAKYMGPHSRGPMGNVIKSFEWVDGASKEVLYDMIEMRIKAGTTGAPDKLKERETWAEMLPILMQQMQVVMQIQASGQDASPFENLIEQTVKRFDERIDPEMFIPKPQAMPQMPAGVHQGIPMGGGLAGQQERPDMQAGIPPTALKNLPENLSQPI